MLVMQQLELWRKPQVLCLCPETVPVALQQLHKDLVAALAQREIGFDQRAYRPHVTLARKVRMSPEKDQVDEPIKWRVNGFSLLESESTDNGVRYVVLQSW